MKRLNRSMFIAAAVLGATMSAPAWAQCQQEKSNVIVVTALNSTDVGNDQAVVRMSTKVTGVDLTSGTKAINARAKDIQDRLKNLGVDGTSVSIRPSSDSERDTKTWKPTGKYTVATQVTVKLPADKVGDVLGEAVAAGFEADAPVYSISDKVQKETRALLIADAIALAKVEAEAIAATFQADIKPKPLSVKPARAGEIADVTTRSMSASPKGVKVTTTSGSGEVEASFTIVFELK